MRSDSDEQMVRFEVGSCLVPRRLTALIEKFILDKRTGNVRLNIKRGSIRGVQVEEIVDFGGKT